tara:strand:- start:471 stop:1211 length:741 start_codon:yes stop_codon:yes gene_type:complete
MPTVYAASTDGRVNQAIYSGASWSSVRDNDSGSSASATVGSSTTAVGVQGVTSRGGGYRICRAFFAFDTSGITSTVASATISIYGSNGAGSDCDVIGVKATKPDTSTNIASADFDAITGWTDGASANGNVTDYTAEVATWSSSGYNEITLSSDALADLVSLDTFAICFMEYDKDYLNSDPGTSHGNTFIGMYFQENSGTSKDPKIDYTLAATAEVATVAGVAEASISTVAGVANASIAQIIDVDMP